MVPFEKGITFAKLTTTLFKAVIFEMERVAGAQLKSHTHLHPIVGSCCKMCAALSLRERTSRAGAVFRSAALALLRNNCINYTQREGCAAAPACMAKANNQHTRLGRREKRSWLQPLQFIFTVF
jgi:hypothetical protein